MKQCNKDAMVEDGFAEQAYMCLQLATRDY